MNETTDTQRKLWSRLRLRAGPLLIVLCVLVLALIGTQLRPLILTATFFQAMDGIPEWGAGWDDVGETPALCRAEVAARFLLEQPEPDRRWLISAYTRYTLARRRAIDNYNCTMRRYVGSIHQIPDDYPQKNFRTFILLRLLFDAPETHLWPLGVEGGRLVLKDTPDTWGGSYYDGLAEYDNLTVRFPWRPADQLGCGATVAGPATPAPGCTEDGLVRQERIESPTLGRPFTFAYYLPPCYEQRATVSYPVLYLIPGGGGTPSSWTVDMRGAEAADRLIHGGQVPPFILVTMPNISDDQHGAALIDDLIPYVDGHLRTLPDRRHRGVGGASLGGLIAYRMAFQHPDLFASLGLFGGVVRPEEEAIDGWIAAMPAGQRPRVLMDYGDQDLLLTKSQLLRDILDRWGIEYTLNVEPGDHDLLLWSGHLEMYLTWYAEDW